MGQYSILLFSGKEGGSLVVETVTCQLNVGLTVEGCSMFNLLVFYKIPPGFWTENGLIPHLAIMGGGILLCSQKASKWQNEDNAAKETKRLNEELMSFLGPESTFEIELESATDELVEGVLRKCCPEKVEPTVNQQVVNQLSASGYVGDV